MFHHILVPLDGSPLAEAALPPAMMLAQRLRTRVTLVHLIERDAAPQVHGERHLTQPAEAEAYLAEVARRWFPPGLCVACHVHSAATADLARGIVAHQAELAPDLIVMCTHGHGGLRTLLYGSIAQQVVAGGHLPVLLVRAPAEPAPTPFDCQRLLVPVDGQPEHERGLAVAADLAAALDAALELLFVVPTAGSLAGKDAQARRLMPGTTRLALEFATEDATGYLEAQTQRLRARGLRVQAAVGRGLPATVIAGWERERGAAGLLVLGTHGKAGTGAFWSGSTASQILAATRGPLLLVPVAPPPA